MFAKEKCKICGCTDLSEQNSTFYCNRCGAQSQVFKTDSEIKSTYYASSKSLQIKEKRSQNEVQKIEKKFTPIQFFQNVYTIYVDAFEEIGFSGLREIAKVVWFDYLYCIRVCNENNEVKSNNENNEESAAAADMNEMKTFDLHKISNNTLLCLCLVSLRCLGYCVSYADIHRFVREGRVPFSNIHSVLPYYMKFHDNVRLMSSDIYIASSFYDHCVAIFKNFKIINSNIMKANHIDKFIERYVRELHLPHFVLFGSKTYLAVWEEYAAIKNSSIIYRDMFIMPDIYAIAIIMTVVRIYFCIPWKTSAEVLSDIENLKKKELISQLKDMWESWKLHISNVTLKQRYVGDAFDSALGYLRYRTMSKREALELVESSRDCTTQNRKLKNKSDKNALVHFFESHLSSLHDFDVKNTNTMSKKNLEYFCNEENCLMYSNKLFYQELFEDYADDYNSCFTTASLESCYEYEFLKLIVSEVFKINLTLIDSYASIIEASIL